MHIAHFVHTYLPDWGGTATRLYHLLAESEHTYSLFISYPKTGRGDAESLERTEQFGNITVYRSTHKPVRIKGFFLYKGAADIATAAELLCDSRENSGADVYHGHNPLEYALAALKTARKYNKPFIYEIHRLWFDVPFIKTRYLPIWVKKALQVVYLLVCHHKLQLDRTLAEAADVLIVQTEQQKNRVVSLFNLTADKIRIIPMGADVDRFSPVKWSGEGAAIRARYGWEGKTVFMYNGLFETTTGVDFLLKSVKRIPRRIRDRIQIVFIGNGVLAAAVEKKCRKYDFLTFRNAVSHDEIPGYYAAIDVNLIPLPDLRCWAENVPTKLLEGMAMEKTVLASDVHGISHVVTHNENGIIYKAGNVRDFVGKMNGIVDGEFRMAAIGANARRKVSRDFNWVCCRKLMLQCYEAFRQ